MINAITDGLQVHYLNMALPTDKVDLLPDGAFDYEGIKRQ